MTRGSGKLTIIFINFQIWHDRRLIAEEDCFSMSVYVFALRDRLRSSYQGYIQLHRENHENTNEKIFLQLQLL